jgi:hypothetical protein
MLLGCLSAASRSRVSYFEYTHTTGISIMQVADNVKANKPQKDPLQFQKQTLVHRYFQSANYLRNEAIRKMKKPKDQSTFIVQKICIYFLIQ